jgi:hypothetical protein
VGIVPIDTFIVPEDSTAKFIEEIRGSAASLRTPPGFVEGFAYKKTDEANSNVRPSGRTKRHVLTPDRAQRVNSGRSASILRRSRRT